METNIFNYYHLPYDYKSENPESYKGIWSIDIVFYDLGDYEPLGTVSIDKKFNSLEETLKYASEINAEETDKLCNENITDEGYGLISIEILCDMENGETPFVVANTLLFEPLYTCEIS